MEKFVKELFTEGVIKEITSLYSIEKEQLYFVGGFENYVYGFEKDNKSYIVRISHSSHRTLDEVKAEIDFLFYLSGKGADVSMPIKTIYGSLVEKINCNNDSYFIVCAFTKAEGEVPSRLNASDKMFYNYGKTIGTFHKLTKDYKVSDGIKKRYTWDQDLLITNARNYIHENDFVIIQRLEELVNEINRIERSINNYGLIHTDIHMGNFFIKDDELTVFDFDDVAYQYFISDIAIALYYLVFMTKEDEQYVLADRFMDNFMKGYLSINNLSLDDYLKIPLFLKLREIILYIVLHRTIDIENNNFAKVYINRYRDRIINKTPFLNLDYKKYYSNK